MDTRALYEEFAAQEARGESPLFEEWALGTAADDDLIALLDALPPGKRQPNLLFAATRLLHGTPPDFPTFRDTVLTHRDEIVAAMLARRTQTNEVGRCANLYPLLATLPQPLALLEVGTSAGLCLMLDRYRYEYHDVAMGDWRIAGDPDSTLTLTGEIGGAGPGGLLGFGTVEVAWRAGIDINPLDVTSAEDMTWLRTLVWPGQPERLARLDTAIEIARKDPPRILAGHLNDRLADLAAEAPNDATLVVFHTSVLNYLTSDDRARFVDQVMALPGHWVSQESPGTVHTIDVPQTWSGHPPQVLALDGVPLAATRPHGGRIHWLSAPADHHHHDHKSWYTSRLNQAE